MKILNIKTGNEVPPDLKALSDAMSDGIKTEDGKVVLESDFDENDGVIVHDYDSGEDFTFEASDSDAAYLKFRFLVEALYHESLPHL